MVRGSTILQVSQRNSLYPVIPAEPSSAEPHRQRLMQAMVELIVAQGYAPTTIADIVRRAHVSKRTFYEYFADKQACLLACYADANERALSLMQASTRASEGRPWAERLGLSLRAFLEAREETPQMRTLMIEILASGREGLRLRRESLQRFADTLRELVDSERRLRPELPALSPAMATAIVGGIQELLLQAYEEGRQQLTDLREPLNAFVQTIANSLEAQAGTA